MKRTVQTGNALILIVVLTAAVLSLGYIFYLNFKSASVEKPEPVTTNKQEQERPQENNQLRDYTSRNLKISFKYPEEWYVEDEYPSILISNFKSSLHENFDLKKNQIEILIRNFNGCHDSIEENLMDPACGEGGPTVSKNKIVVKETRQIPEGTFYKYVINTPQGNQFTYYLLQKGDLILQIEKHPDPSQFEREFEEIVTSIRFL